ncbi:hypothetical protein KQI36_07655 [Clostridium senegalense]|uniref:hypothetical protein n=1 Tax=Clostridium senegalense TaxID=1465809 RepID=UPI001C1133D2|nr:hypothetical protein [Clostridium senegalense]MBU5226519.1 hypothetical protein [Clostridium senegalense]
MNKVENEKRRTEHLLKSKSLYEEYLDESNNIDEYHYLAEDLKLTIDYKLGSDANADDIEMLTVYQKEMLKEKFILDDKFLNNLISPDEYAEKVNHLMSQFINKSSNQLGEKKFKMLFDFSPMDDIKIIDPNILKNGVI